jgi:hypothetical protein
MALLFLLWIFYKYWKKQQAEANVRKEESMRKEDVEIGRGEAGKGKEDAGKGKENAGKGEEDAEKGKDESGNKTWRELDKTSPGGGARKELSSESKTGTLLFNPHRPLCQLNIAAGTHCARPHPDRNRQQSQFSIMTGSTSYDPRSDYTRHLSLGSAANGGRVLPELPVDQSQSPNSPPSPTAAADVTAQGEE